MAVAGNYSQPPNTSTTTTDNEKLKFPEIPKFHALKPEKLAALSDKSN